MEKNEPSGASMGTVTVSGEEEDRDGELACSRNRTVPMRPGESTFAANPYTIEGEGTNRTCSMSSWSAAGGYTIESCAKEEEKEEEEEIEEAALGSKMWFLSQKDMGQLVVGIPVPSVPTAESDKEGPKEGSSRKDGLFSRMLSIVDPTPLSMRAGPDRGEDSGLHRLDSDEEMACAIAIADAEEREERDTNAARRESTISLPGAFSVEGIEDGSLDSAGREDRRETVSLPSRFEFECLAEATLVVEDPPESSSVDSQGLNDHIEGRPHDDVDPTNHTHDVPRRVGTDGQRTVSSSLASLEFTGEDEEHEAPLPRPEGSDDDANALIVEAKPMQGCIMSRRRVVLLGIAVLMAIALSFALPFVINSGEELPPKGHLFPNNEEIVSYAPSSMCFSLLPLLSNVSKACPDPTSMPRGGPLNQLVVDGLVEASDPAAGIDVAIINAGAVRGDIMEGPLTVGHVRSTVLPFVTNRVVYLSVTPAEIKATLEGSLAEKELFGFSEELQMEFFPNVPPLRISWAMEAPYPYTAGLRYDVNLTAPDGEKFTGIEIQPRFANGAEGWVKMDVTDDTTLIRVLTSDFLAGGGDGYFPGIPDERKETQEELGITDLFLLFCSQQEELALPAGPSSMSTQGFIPLEGH